VDEREHDGSLVVVLYVLRCVHQRFFDGDHVRTNVREVIAEVCRQVLCTVAFNFLKQVKPKTTLTWRLAKALRAMCMKDIDDTVTHIVVEDRAVLKLIILPPKFQQNKRL
jgi:RNA polymerase II C-terminal domain phosphatase-like 3/4